MKDAAAPGGEDGYITRINLDADGEHRVTLLASTDSDGKPLPDFDGSTWDPFAERLLFTAEIGNQGGGVWQATVDFPSTVEDISSVFGRAGYEGIQNDSDGNVWIVEDTTGAAGNPSTHAKQPNSFVYRFIPDDRSNLKSGGKLQALQVQSKAHAGPIVFNVGQAEADIQSQDAGRCLPRPRSPSSALRTSMRLAYHFSLEAGAVRQPGSHDRRTGTSST